MNGIVTSVAIAFVSVLTATALISFIKTVREGSVVFDDFDRAGFTWSAFWLGRVPESDASSSLHFGESAEISVVNGKIKAIPTRTVSKTLS